MSKNGSPHSLGGSVSTSSFLEKKFVIVFMFVTSLFLMWGVATTMGDILNKHFQTALGLEKSESAFVQFSIYGSYAIMGLPAGIFMKKFGYKKGVLLGLFLYAFGAFLFIPAAEQLSFDFFRIALFILGCGLATLETVATPFIASIGSPQFSAQRVNLAQAFNGLGGVLGLLVGGYFILGNTNEPMSLDPVKNVYTWIGIVIVSIGVAFSVLRIPSIETESKPVTGDGEQLLIRHPLRQRHFIWAVIAQFFNVAAQAGTWAYFINYGVEHVDLSAESVAYYFALSMVIKVAGRFLGTYLMVRFIAPNKLLAIFATGNILMCLIIAQGWGWFSFTALIMLNFFFSIMVPTIYGLGLKNLGNSIHKGSSVIIMSMLGGAVFPFAMGWIANQDVATAYYLPIVCYFVIFLFGYKFYKPLVPITA